MAISVANGNLYFANRLWSDKWENASIDDRGKALDEAEDLILTLPYDTELVPDLDDLPVAVQNAAYEQALALLSGKSIDLEIKASKIIRDKWSTIESEYRKDSLILTNLLYGILSVKAWLLLQPYLINSQEITLSRVS